MYSTITPPCTFLDFWTPVTDNGTVCVGLYTCQISFLFFYLLVFTNFFSFTFLFVLITGLLLVGHCRLLNSYKAHITSSISDVCTECGVAPHSVEHLFNCQSHPTQLTVQDLWDNPAAVADFLNLDN